MTEMEVFLNTHHTQINQAILCVGPEYTQDSLNQLLNCTNLESLILTGYISAKDAKKIMEPLIFEAQCNKRRVPNIFQFIPLNRLDRPNGDFALLCTGLEESVIFTGAETGTPMKSKNKD